MRRVVGWCVACWLAGLAAPLWAQTPDWDAKTQGGFVMSLASDAQGRIWAGTEDQGVWCWQPDARSWTHFGRADGLGDDCAYALACDRAGRVWVGHLNHGVSVYNGAVWRNYDLLSGPLGERVYGLAPAPDGGMWLATSGGLACWSSRSDTWRYFTALDGLPSDPVVAVACDPRGNVYAATAADGLAIGLAADDYARWQLVPGERLPPADGGGPGQRSLPSAQLNALLATPDGSVFVATANGLARTDDVGQTWEVDRGRDWAKFVTGRAAGAPPGFQATVPGTLLEDCCTSLALGGDGRVWVGHLHSGAELFDPAKIARVWPPEGTPPVHDYVHALLAPPGAAPLAGWYAHGLTALDGAPAWPGKPKPGAPATPALPAPAAPPDEAQLAALGLRLAAVGGELPVGGGCFVGEDWSTQGDWVPVYGEAYWFVFPAYRRVRRPDRLVDGRSGPHSLYGRGHGWWWTRQQPPSEEALWDPERAVRYDGEWNDTYGRPYPHGWDGPDMWVDVTVPAGVHRLSVYWHNKDGHDGTNRLRDHLLELRPLITDDTYNGPVLARARVLDWWHGKYLQFAVRGPARYTLVCRRGVSPGACINGVFLDPWLGATDRREPLPVFDAVAAGGFPALADLPPAPAPTTARERLWAALDASLARRETLRGLHAARVWCYRAAVAAGDPPEQLRRWRRTVGLWTPADRQAFRAAMARIPPVGPGPQG